MSFRDCGLGLRLDKVVLVPGRVLCNMLPQMEAADDVHAFCKAVRALAAACHTTMTARATCHGMTGTSLYSITAQNWNLFNGVVRRIISDYGTALCVLLWTLVSLAPQDTPAGIPRRLVIPDTFGAAFGFRPDFRVAGRGGVVVDEVCVDECPGVWRVRGEGGGG